MASPTPSEIRSQAVAKLKRAAFLPRTPRRPSQARDQQILAPQNEPHTRPQYHDDEEMLAVSPQPSASYDAREDSLSPSMPTPSSSHSINSQNPSPTPDRSYHLLPPGRSTPSPLPTLGELRLLSRSNSTAARANAMKKLMGDSSPDTPIIKPSLQRADSLSAKPDVPVVAVSPEYEEDAFSTPQSTRLARSHTVGAGGGEERRSVVGRRMMARLGNRTPVEKPAAGEGSVNLARQLSLSELRARAQSRKAAEEASEPSEAPEPIPLVSPPSTEELRASPLGLHPDSSIGLAPAERSVSRGTNFSTGTGEEAFEYEHHLRRSMSGRTARTAEVVPRESQDTYRSLDGEGPDDVETITGQFNDADLGLPLPVPQPPFHQPSLHTPHGSTSTAMTESPGGSSTTDVLGQMVFMVGDRSQPRGFSGTYPIGIDDSHTSWREEPAGGEEEGVASPSGPSSLYGDHLEPSSRESRALSGMSWEQIPTQQDLGVPMDHKYHQKSDSVVSKIERSLRGTLRKSRRGSSSTTSEAPTSPLMRRESEASLPRKNSQTSMSRKPSYSSITPLESSRAGSILSVPLVASGKSSPLPMPAADALDSRYLDSKLSPFPGMAQLEQERNRKRSDAGEEIPKLVHQSSDPIVQQTHTRPDITSVDSSLSLPTSGQQTQYIDLPSDLAESSTGRKGWLAKAFSQQSRGKRPSISDSFRKLSDTPTTPEIGMAAEAEDPFAASPLKSPKSAPRHRSASPSVSVVHEGSDEGSRWTRFSTTLHDKASPLSQPLQPQSVDVLNRLDAVLSLSGDDPARPTMLDDPPRKLLLCSQVLQVVNSYTVKDRYLFLFTDILVIAKPLLVNTEPATLDMKFVVKSIVSLNKLSVSGIREEETDNRSHPVVLSFIERFGRDPAAAVEYLVERSNPKVDDVTLASLLFKTPELDREQIGLFLSLPAQKAALKAFIDRFHFAGVRVDDALRMFLLSLRLPTEANASESLLKGFATRWYEANHDTISFDRDLALNLVLAIMQLNDALHEDSSFGYFAFPNQAIVVDDFIGAFRAKDPRQSVHDDLLYDIYDSVREDMLTQALPISRHDEERSITIIPRLPAQLTYNVWSEPITVRIPHADPDFGIRLHGEGLQFEPSALDFTTSSTQSFRVRGSILGVKSMLFDRVGLNAALYASIGNTRTFAIERAFMAHTFQIAFVNHLNTKRKYCFSVDDAETRKRWAQVLLAQVKRAAVPRGLPVDPKQQQIRLAAETVALQVLRDAVIGRDEKPGKAPRGRSGSVSAVYGQRAGHAEVGLPYQAQGVAVPLTDKDSGLLEVQSGKELVLLCRQNSLLPLVLGFLQGGVAENNVV